MKQKILAVLNEINHGLIERDDILKTALLTVLTGEHLVLIGPPGTAKSAIARRISESFLFADEANYFEYLLTKFSTPEEIFGPLSITELRADRFRRNTAGYLPTARIAFLDEIFKANSSILNSLLTILNERIFHNGSEPQHVPLLSLISASNELPVGVEELNALYDRFLVRVLVNPVSESGRGSLFDIHSADKSFAPGNRIDLAEVAAFKKLAGEVIVPENIKCIVLDIWAEHQKVFQEDRRELLSDRRMTKVLKLLRTSAATNDRTEVNLSDLVLLKDCLWNHAENREKVGTLVFTALKKHTRMVPRVEQSTEPVAPTVSSADATVTTGSAQNALAPTRTTLKGFSGSGTANDPIRIASADDLQAMDDEDIRNKGYYFVQTQDIDCTDISSWPKFSFQGHYNGNGKTIRFGHRVASKKSTADRNNGSASNLFSGLQNSFVAVQNTISNSTSSKPFFVFHVVQDSSITNLTLEGCGLAQAVEATRINRCTSTKTPLVGTALQKTDIAHCNVQGSNLVSGDVKGTSITCCSVSEGDLVHGDTKETTITHCHVKGGSLITGNTESNTCISRCEVIDGEALVCGTASSTQIADCLVVMKSSRSSTGTSEEITVGMIARELFSDTMVERSYVTGSFSMPGNRVNFGGIAGRNHNGGIRQCAVGPHTLNCGSFSDSNRIVTASNFGSGNCQNNAAIDSVSGDDDPNGPDGKTVAAARFNQRFFRDSLGWDFVNVWQWDAANNRPALRIDVHTFRAIQLDGSDPDSDMEDLLTREIRDNIWL